MEKMEMENTLGFDKSGQPSQVRRLRVFCWRWVVLLTAADRPSELSLFSNLSRLQPGSRWLVWCKTPEERSHSQPWSSRVLVGEKHIRRCQEIKTWELFKGDQSLSLFCLYAPLWFCGSNAGKAGGLFVPIRGSRWIEVQLGQLFHVHSFQGSEAF